MEFIYISPTIQQICNMSIVQVESCVSFAPQRKSVKLQLAKVFKVGKNSLSSLWEKNTSELRLAQWHFQSIHQHTEWRPPKVQFLKRLVTELFVFIVCGIFRYLGNNVNYMDFRFLLNIKELGFMNVTRT